MKGHCWYWKRHNLELDFDLGQGKTLMGKKNSSKSENTLWSQVTEILEYTYNTIVFKQVAKFSNLTFLLFLLYIRYHHSLVNGRHLCFPPVI